MTKNPPTPPTLTPIEQILDLARWAPSGDNMQPWRFKITDDRHLVVCSHALEELGVYDLTNQAGPLALGVLLENIRIAATSHGLACTIKPRVDDPAHALVFDVALQDDPQIQHDPLVSCIETRVTQRRPMRLRAMTEQQRAELEQAVSPNYRVIWLDRFRARCKMARLLSYSARIRLSIPETFPIHQKIIQWGARFSPDRIPDKAIGLDPMTVKMMQWALGKWQRADFLNKYLGGTMMPRIELDILPAIFCSAHFFIVSADLPNSDNDFVEAGKAFQRFWLTATRLDLLIQPEMTPLIFSSYVRSGLRFTKDDRAWKQAQSLPDRLDKLIGSNEEGIHTVCMGRIGSSRIPNTRSTRQPLDQLTC